MNNNLVDEALEDIVGKKLTKQMRGGRSMQVSNGKVIDRTKAIGGTDVAAILGFSSWKTAFDVFEEKMGIEREEVTEEQEKLFQRGHRYELTGLQLYCEAVSNGDEKVNPSSFELDVHKTHRTVPFIAAQIDALSDSRQVEIKTVGQFALKRWTNGWEACLDGVEFAPPRPVGGYYLPIDYYLQVQHAMMCSERESCDVFCITAKLDEQSWEVDFQQLLFKVEANTALQDKIFAEEVRFWNENVLRGVEPSSKSEEETRKVLQMLQGASKEVGDSVMDLAWIVRNARDDINKATKEKNDAEAKVRKMMLDNKCAELTCNGKSIFKIVNRQKVSINSKDLKENHPDIYSKYSVEKSYQTMYCKLF